MYFSKKKEEESRQSIESRNLLTLTANYLVTKSQQVW
jgi:hypothetical protein